AGADRMHADGHGRLVALDDAMLAGDEDHLCGAATVAARGAGEHTEGGENREDDQSEALGRGGGGHILRRRAAAPSRFLAINLVRLDTRSGDSPAKRPPV